MSMKFQKWGELKFLYLQHKYMNIIEIFKEYDRCSLFLIIVLVTGLSKPGSVIVTGADSVASRVFHSVKSHFTQYDLTFYP